MLPSELNISRVESIIGYSFRDKLLLIKALTAGDTESDDREGNRRMAQVGDSLMGFAILDQGFNRGISRQAQNEATSTLKSKDKCAVFVRSLGLDRMITLSVRQSHVGPQPTILKNALTAIVAAVWYDSSHDYDTILRVMVALGVINNMTVDPQDMLLSTPLRSPASVNIDTPMGTSEDENSMGDFLSPEVHQQAGGGVHLDGLFVADYCVDFAAETPAEPTWPTSTDDLDRTITSISTQGVASLSSLMLPQADQSWPKQRAYVEDFSSIAMNQDRSGAMSSNDSNTTKVSDTHRVPEPMCVAQGASMSICGADGNIGSGTKRQKVPRSGYREVFSTYTASDRARIAGGDETFQENYRSLEIYQAAISRLPSQQQKQLAVLATAIGDSSAFLLLQETLRDLHSPSPNEMLLVPKTLPMSQRLEIIRGLDCCAAHLRLSRWLHICMLCEDAEQVVGAKGSDGFLLVDPRSTSGGLQTTRRARGNPRNLDQAEITERFVEQATIGPNDKSESQKDLRSQMTMLRRTGQRLLSLVNRWGFGVLALLGFQISDEIILGAATDTNFAAIVKLIDDHEGRKIQFLCAKLLPVVQLLLQNNIEPPPCLSITSVDINALQQLPRLSSELVSFITWRDSSSSISSLLNT